MGTFKQLLTVQMEEGMEEDELLQAPEEQPEQTPINYRELMDFVRHHDHGAYL
jgi:hypothetical protein